MQAATESGTAKLPKVVGSPMESAIVLLFGLGTLFMLSTMARIGFVVRCDERDACTVVHAMGSGCAMKQMAPEHVIIYRVTAVYNVTIGSIASSKGARVRGLDKLALQLGTPSLKRSILEARRTHETPIFAQVR